MANNRTCGHAEDLSASLEIVTATDRGRVRRLNEDCYTALPPEGLVAVADGAGGHRDGNRASRIVVESLEDLYLAEAELPLEKYSGWVPRGFDLGVRKFLFAVELANYRLYTLNRVRNGDGGALRDKMAAAFCALKVADGVGYIAHVGDVRAYRLRGADLRVLTVDHLSARAVERSDRPGGQAFLTRVMGIHETVPIDLNIINCRDRDTFLLCTDGLHRVLAEEKIRETLENAGADLRAAAGELIDQANAKGGPDNITAAFVKYHGPETLPDAPESGFCQIDAARSARSISRIHDKVYGQA